MPYSSAVRKSSSRFCCSSPAWCLQALPLHDRVVQLAVAGRDLLAADDQLEDIDDGGIGAVLPRQRDQFLGKMRDEKRVPRFGLDEFFEDLVGDFKVLHRGRDFNAQLCAPFRRWRR
jgi:hypothetical protein